jgi:hypothetical protein
MSPLSEKASDKKRLYPKAVAIAHSIFRVKLLSFQRLQSCTLTYE